MLRLKIAPTVEPITLAQAQSHASVHSTATSDVAFLNDVLIPAARDKFEQEAGFYLSQVTFEWECLPSDVRIDCEGRNYIEIPVRPFLPTASPLGGGLFGGTLFAGNQAAFTLDSDIRGIGRIRLAEGFTIEEETLIEFNAGYEDPVDDNPHPCPPRIKLALLSLVAHWYRNREAYSAIPGALLKETPAAFDSVVRGVRLA